MEGFALALFVQPTKQHDRGGLRRRGECEDGHIGLLAITPDLVSDHVLRISVFLLTRAKGLRDCRHVLSGGGGMRFIDNDREGFILQALHAVNDVGELLNGGGDDLRVAVQRHGQVGRIALIVHHPDQASLVLHAHDGLLQLPIHHHTVGDNDHVIKDDLVIRIVKGGESMRQPCDGVGLAGTGAMLDQVVLAGAVLPHIGQHPADDI